MKVGLGSFAYRWAIGRDYYKPSVLMNIDQFIAKAIFHGMQGVMIYNNFNLERISIQNINKIRKLIENNGMFIETGTRGKSLDFFLKILNVTKEFGAKLMRVIYDIDRNVSMEEINHQINSARICFRELLEASKKNGIILAVENYFDMNVEEIRSILEYFNDEYIGACIDITNSIPNIEKPENVINTLLPYAKTFHFKDYKIERNPRGYIIKGVALGDGEINFYDLMKIINKKDFSSSICLELYIDRKETFEETIAFEEECVEKSVRFAKKIGLIQI